MTLIIVHNNPITRREYLLGWLNNVLNKQYSQISQILNDPDIHIIDNPSNVSIKIEQVKEFQREMVYKPFGSNFQIGIIFHSDMLTHEAQNALLKTLEEQGDTTHYALLAQSSSNLLPTILSRGKKYYPQEEPQEIEDEQKEIGFSHELIETFFYIESIVEEQKEDKGRIEQTLTSLEHEYTLKLETAIKNNDRESIVCLLKKNSAILTAKKRLQRNVNKRLLLENLAIQLNS